MELLIIAATSAEIAPVMAELGLVEGQNRVLGSNVTIAFSGVGMVATAYTLGTLLAAKSFDLAVNLGIAGSFDRDVAIGQVVEIVQDTFAELGAEDRDGFLSLPELGFGESAFAPLKPKGDLPLALRKVSAITVNTVHGEAMSIRRVTERLPVSLESMEGAAFFYGCARAGLPSVQVRSVSNYVEPRDRDAWNVPLAIKNLNTFAAKFIQALLAPQVEV